MRKAAQATLNLSVHEKGRLLDDFLGCKFCLGLSITKNKTAFASHLNGVESYNQTVEYCNINK